MQKKLVKAIQRFNERFPSSNGKRVFIMVRLRKDQVFQTIINTIKDQLQENNLQGFTAAEYIFTEESVWENVSVYMLTCELGIAVLEQILPTEQYLNPNVLIELGCMMGGLGKPCLIMKENRIPKLPSDIVKIYQPFDASSLEAAKSTVKEAIQNWIDRTLSVQNIDS